MGLLPKNQVPLLTIHSLLQWDQIESNIYDLVYKVAEAEGAVVKLTEQLALSEAWVAKLEGLVQEQRRTLEDFKDQMSILVSKLLERDSNVEQSFETGEATEPALLCLEQGRRPGLSSGPSAKCDVILTLPIVPGNERSGGLAIWSDCQHVQMIVSLWGHP